MLGKDIVQKDNTVLGDQAARDINKQTTIYNIGNQSNNISTIQALLEKFKTERENNTQLNQFIEELDYYNNPLDGDVIGLNKKLEDGKRENLIEYALRVKDAYHRKLYKYQFSEAAQKINLHFLALVESYFMNEVYPRICNEEDPNVINGLISELIINPLSNQLSENPLGW